MASLALHLEVRAVSPRREIPRWCGLRHEAGPRNGDSCSSFAGGPSGGLDMQLVPSAQHIRRSADEEWVCCQGLEAPQ